MSLSRNPKGFEIAKVMWQRFFQQEQGPVPTVRSLTPQATEIVFTGEKSPQGRLLFFLLAAVGHPVYL